MTDNEMKLPEIIRRLRRLEHENGILENENRRLREALETILNAGTWYLSALEIDQFDTDTDGEQLEAMGRAALRTTDKSDYE